MQADNNNFILGTANFGQRYGISKKNKIKLYEIKKIIEYANKNKIKFFDTSRSYKNSEKILGKNIPKFSKIITKIPPVPNSIKSSNIERWFKKQVLLSSKKLNVKKFHAILLHKSEALLGKEGHKLYKVLIKLKKEKITKKIGVSIYNFDTLNKILKKFKIDVIQLPFNVFDQRLLYKKIRFHQSKPEIHIRSIFLQGLLLMSANKLPKKLRNFKKYWILWHKLLSENNMKPINACLNFILNCKNKFDYIVIGCEDVNQLKQIVSYKRKKNLKNFYNIRIKDKRFYSPFLLRR